MDIGTFTNHTYTSRPFWIWITALQDPRKSLHIPKNYEKFQTFREIVR
jgi:hypothetical protein